jgi:hypothetical protein
MGPQPESNNACKRNILLVPQAAVRLNPTPAKNPHPKIEPPARFTPQQVANSHNHATVQIIQSGIGT